MFFHRNFRINGERLTSNQSDVTYTDLLEARRLLALHFTELTHTSWPKMADSFFEQGDKNGKLLAMLVAEQRVQANIPCITNSQGTLLTDSNDILDTFVDYYRTLYAPILAYNEQDLESSLLFFPMHSSAL